jgi:hypothetical protein
LKVVCSQAAPAAAAAVEAAAAAPGSSSIRWYEPGAGGQQGSSSSRTPAGGSNSSSSGDVYCYGCLKGLGVSQGGSAAATGAQVGLVLRCGQCRQLFCYDCDAFIHESLHNCPGCECCAPQQQQQAGPGAEGGSGEGS